MADNRMYLRCRGCGAELMLAKSFMHDWHNVKTAEEKGQELFDFIERHQHCCDELDVDICGVDPYDNDFEPFELTYENRPDWGNQPTLQQLAKEKELGRIIKTEKEE